MHLSTNPSCKTVQLFKDLSCARKNTINPKFFFFFFNSQINIRQTGKNTLVLQGSWEGKK